MNIQSSTFDSLLRQSDPLIAETLDRALSEKEVSASEATRLFYAKGIDFHLIGMVSDDLRKRRIGDVVTYVINRNINFTNVCIKQCGFCAFSRDFREEEGYFLPIDEIVRRAKEARALGATEICVQAGLPPDMDGHMYENICRAIKKEVGDIHIHGFSPEEVLYGAVQSNLSVKEYLKLLKDADGRDVLLMHAISRIMLNNYINNIQTSWVKEGSNMAQLLLAWGANDFGGTLINESISTAAGALNGQLLKPKEIRRLIRQADRIPVQRTTSYKIIKTFSSDEHEDPLDEIQDASKFGSYHELIKLDRYRYKSSRRS